MGSINGHLFVPSTLRLEGTSRFLGFTHNCFQEVAAFFWDRKNLDANLKHLK